MRRVKPLRPPVRATPPATPFSKAKAEWDIRKRRLGDRAVGRIGEDHIKQGARIADALRPNLAEYYSHGLDFGCGWGRLTDVLTGVCGHLWAVDIYEDWVERAATAPAVTGVTLTSTTLPLEDASMNLIVDIMTFQSIRSAQVKEAYARELQRILVPGGTFISLAKEEDEWSWDNLHKLLRLKEPIVKLGDSSIDEVPDTYYFLVGEKRYE